MELCQAVPLAPLYRHFELDVFQKEAIIHMENVRAWLGFSVQAFLGAGASACFAAYRLCITFWLCRFRGLSACVHVLAYMPQPASSCPMVAAGPLRVCGRPHQRRQDGGC